jgi:nucleoside-diphosphate-sugar epimerase
VADKTAQEPAKVLVTGASGFIGTRLIGKLAAEDGFIVTAMVRNSAKPQQLGTNGVRVIAADMSDRTEIDRAVSGHHTVINLVHDFKRSQKHNLRCFTNLYEACIKHGVQHLVHVSSIVVYDDWPGGDITEESPSGQPGTEYKNTKVAIEKALQSGSDKGLLHSIILQPTIVYGPNSWLWTDHVVEKLRGGTLVLPAEEDGVCNAVYLDDVADALVLAALRPGNSSEKYIISGPAPTGWREFFESHNQYLGTDSIQYLDVAELAAVHSGSSGTMKSIVANPLQLANWKPVRSVLNGLQGVLGDRAIDGLKALVKGLKKSTGRVVYYPDPAELELYCASGVCSSEKAKSVLGYEPKFDFKTGFASTTGYIDNKW